MTRNNKIALGIGAAIIGFFIATKKDTPTGGGGTSTDTDAEFERYMPHIFKFEGGYTNDPFDKGGETNFGITKRNYPNLDIKNITKAQAKDIYFRDYWLKGRVTALPKQIRFLFFDTYINGGGVIVLQRAANVKMDGVMGPVTTIAAATVTAEAYTAARKTRYDILIKNDPTQAKFRKGWMRRADEALQIQKQVLLNV
jgi:lysozyme family protein